MRHRFFCIKLITGILALILMTMAKAGTPLWTFLPLTPTTVVISPSNIVSVQYLVTNQSPKTHYLVMTPIQGVTQVTSSGNCSNPFTLAYHQSCTLNLAVNGGALNGNVIGGPIVCEQGNPLQCYQPSKPNTLNITTTTNASSLTASVNNLALSVNNTALNPALTGNPRVITISNGGNFMVQGLSINYPTWPAGTTASTTCGPTLAVGAQCTITITPGVSPTSNCNTGISPTPGVITVNTSNATPLSINAEVLSYGCIYQGGYIYSIDDTTANTGSIGGKVVSQTDQGSVVWSSDAAGAGIFDTIWGIDQNSTVASPSPNAASTPPATLLAGQNNCNGDIDGPCDTNNIIVFYSPPNKNPAINLSFYAAGLCKSTISGYSDWFLPAICEMGYDRLTTGSNCGSAASPTAQNMQSNLVDTGIIPLSGGYWSSTEDFTFPDQLAWNQNFQIPPSINDQSNLLKSGTFPVRCARALIP